MPEQVISECVVAPLAYIGPGAGFAFLGSFLILFAACGLALLSLVLLPFRMAMQMVLGGRKRRRGAVRRAVVVGLDGLDPVRTKRMIDAGKLPHLAELAAKGTFSKLNTTCPPMSPVAWSSFMTGVNPGKHNIFDFVNRDLKTYAPELSSSRIRSGNTALPFRKKRSSVEPLRKSKPFWQVLGDYGVMSAVLRVPITFPPEKFKGMLLSAMCAPDIRGTQGTYTLYDSRELPDDELTEGVRIRVHQDSGRVKTQLPGPPLESGKTIELPVTIDIDVARDAATVRLGKKSINLVKGIYSDWVNVEFRSGLHKISGICRLLLLSVEPHFRLYVTPINIDPARPAMPVSHPGYYSTYLSKLVGPYATLGLAEDTWALTHGIISDEHFLQQVWDIHDERERMFLETVARMRTGFCCCVFDASDRVQHMFWRQASKPDDDPSAEGGPDAVIDETYCRLDATIGRIMERLDSDTPLFVLSDHGFSSFKHGVNLNAWLKQEGLLVESDPKADTPDLSNVDWKQTKAYTFGLSGIYLNIQGREAQGCVTVKEVETLKKRIMDGLREIRDPANDGTPLRGVYDADTVYTGPYRNAGPDIVVGFDEGYRASWEAALGRTDGELFSVNDRPWSGDHCVDRSIVPGVLFCNRKLELPDEGPHITDLAPTVLDWFGIEPPEYIDGTVLRSGVGPGSE